MLRSGREKAREAHPAEARRIFNNIGHGERVLLFCHDPTALPFLAGEPAVMAKLPQLERTIIGHLHTPAVFNLARRLAGMPRINFFGATTRRLSFALRQAKVWQAFHLTLCPSPTGIQLLKDGGFLTLQIDTDRPGPVQPKFHGLPWETPRARGKKP